jgi:cytochrome o ubiquinol oxidase subunit IV
MAGANAMHAVAPPGDGEDHGHVRSYVTGFVLSVALTAVPFGLVMSGAVAAGTVVPVCIGFAAVQMVIHLVYFLHMNRASSRSWNMAALVFTVIVVAILVVGSLWIMYHLDTNMMPGVMPPE